LKLIEEDNSVYLRFRFDSALKSLQTPLVTTEMLGKPQVTGWAYENRDGSPLKVDTDYFDAQRDASKPTAGPFENPGDSNFKLKVW